MFKQLRLALWSHSGKKVSNCTLLLVNQSSPLRRKWHAGTKTDGDGSLNDLFFTDQRVLDTRSPKSGLVRYKKSVCVCVCLFSLVCDFCDAISLGANGAIFKALSFTHLPGNGRKCFVVGVSAFVFQ